MGLFVPVFDDDLFAIQADNLLLTLFPLEFADNILGQGQIICVIGTGHSQFSNVFFSRHDRKYVPEYVLILSKFRGLSRIRVPLSECPEAFSLVMVMSCRSHHYRMC